MVNRLDLNGVLLCIFLCCSQKIPKRQLRECGTQCNQVRLTTWRPVVTCELGLANSLIMAEHIQEAEPAASTQGKPAQPESTEPKVEEQKEGSHIDRLYQVLIDRV